MAVAAGDVFLVTINGTCFSQRIMLTLFYAVLNNATPLNEEEASNALANALKSGGAEDIETPYTACLNTSYTCTTVWAQKVYPTRYRRVEQAGTEVGSAGTAEVSNLHGAITLQTIFSARNQQASKHIGPISTATTLISDGVLLPAYKAIFQTLADKLIDDLSLDAGNFTLTPCIFHPFGSSPRFNAVVQYTIQDAVRVSRRRTVGLGI